ncbi:prephenate dehydratase [Methylophilus medardicus]|uniref:Bifunctional chorismate mutase/prephenate dehydratase n=1 Tax=Methylophilus medardicus TaxID=2588534 RepID=A0A5B8CSE5_9PROT|nr:prephenate dehydratase [Methylophilus medardicus]QDC44231.1 prephenate dehydratase [Methylophilus medardicus]QDC49238.1 prephenate dehydratase [Methylophilus medardicus]QDC52943.1 prephenate dehydratase [Methylophilus medardicus]
MSDLLKQFRDKIDAIDAQVLALVNQRAALAREIGHLKDDGVIYRPEREAQIIRRLQADNQGPLSPEAVSHIFRAVMSNCRALEKELSIAFLGPLGTYSEEAALKQFGEGRQAVVCGSIDEVFRTVEAGQADYAVVPVENSTEGAVGITLDLLLSSPLQVIGEVTLPVHHCLLSAQQDIRQISHVFSHAQSLSQCHEWLNKHLPTAEREAVTSNARAAQMIHELVASQGTFAAAIASKRAAELFDLHVLAENIEDDPKNTTRFLVLGNHSVAPSGQDKTSLVMSAHNKPGAMLALLEPLSQHGVSMTKLESRPSRQNLWNYVFFVDIEGHQQQPSVQAALTALAERATFLKVLGSYPTAII